LKKAKKAVHPLPSAFRYNSTNMIDKVLIAEDHASANLSLQKTMEELHITQYDDAYYCDDALTKIRMASKNGQPYDLLITDLSFEADGTRQTIDDGYKLIKAVREIQPEIMVLVFTGEHRPAIINSLYKEYEIDAYVRKARNDVRELKLAFDALSKRQQYYPRALAQLIKQANTYEFTEFDISIIRLTLEGYSQKDIAAYFKQHNIKPSSLSAIEKRLNQVREELGFSNNGQLIAFCKDAGIL
jgi:two-component system, NarL family, captular synthesis response regulator RcsB